VYSACSCCRPANRLQCADLKPWVYRRQERVVPLPLSIAKEQTNLTSQRAVHVCLAAIDALEASVEDGQSFLELILQILTHVVLAV